MKVARLLALHTGRLYPQETFLVLISVRGWVNLRARVQLNGLCQWKITMAPTAIRGILMGSSTPPPKKKISKFWQSWAEFPVPWKIHRQQPNKNMGFTHLQIERNPWLAGYHPQIAILSALCPKLNLLTPLKKIPENATVGNRTRDLPVCSAVPQPTAPHTPKLKIIREAMYV
jgi:hypothetical protein